MIRIKDLSVQYNENETVLKNLSTVFKENKISIILGPNGSGKSTLLKTIIGFLEYSGDIFINNRNLKDFQRLDLAKQIALIPQHYSFGFDYTVEELVLMGRYPYLGYWQSYSKDDKTFVIDILKDLDLYDMKDRYFNRLSGGEKQRVAIARALAQDTDIILMDEPFVNLDVNHQLEIMDIISKIKENGKKAIIVVSHNINLASEFGEEIFFLKNGNIVIKGEANEVINEKTLKEIFDANVRVVKNPISQNPLFVYSK